MEAQNDTSLPILSFNQTMRALDCSRSFMYDLINSRKITPKYLNKKPYFLKEDLMKALEERSEK